MASTDSRLTEQSSTTSVKSASGIQIELRRLFQIAPPNVAMRQSLSRISEHFGAVYASLHGYLAETPLSEEWCAKTFNVGETLRERVTEVMFSVLGGATARCLRLNLATAGDPTAEAEGASVIVAPMFDEELTVTGAASIIIPDADRTRAITVLGQFEGLVGFLALLASTESELKLRMQASAQDELHPSQVAAGAAANAGAAAAEDPWRVGWDLVAHVQQRHGIDQVALGIVTTRGQRSHVTVRLVSGISVARPGNPGVHKIRAAMEEALDRSAPTLCAGRFRADAETDLTVLDDPRLHRQWSESARGDPVATVVLRIDETAVAVVAMRHSKIEKLRLANLAAIEAELQPWGSLIPLVELASRGVVRHAIQRFERTTNRLAGSTGPRRTALSIGIVLALTCMFAFLQVHETLDARARLVPADAQIISTPQTGILLAVHVRPGDSVARGQLLAELDLREATLEAAELRARIRVLAVEVEVARASDELGAMQTAGARIAATQSELAIVEARLQRCEVRAPAAGTVLDQDLRQRLGDNFAIGEPMFTIAANARVKVTMLVPDADLPTDQQMADATIVFLPFAAPGTEVALGACSIPPAATIDQASSVYLVEAEAFPSDGVRLRPGMEGSVRIQLGKVSVWTAWTRPIQRWLRRQLWL